MGQKPGNPIKGAENFIRQLPTLSRVLIAFGLGILFAGLIVPFAPILLGNLACFIGGALGMFLALYFTWIPPENKPE